MDNLEKLKINQDGLVLYKAGLPGYPRNFTRDGIISAILMQDPKMLKDQLIYCAQRQGKRSDPYTGQEPGKIFHESDGVNIGGLSTEYNASDATALFLIGHEIYEKITRDSSLLENQRSNIIDAVKYIRNHLNKYGFIEDPAFSNAKRFALRVTYWKDSILSKRPNGEPEYPVVYTLAHIQNMRAIRSAAYLLKSKTLEILAKDMSHYLRKNLIDEKTKTFHTAVDKIGSIHEISSDFLHSLFYLERSDLTEEILKNLVEKSSELETKAGYRTLDIESSKGTTNPYHTKTIWPFEQAIIHAGAEKFGLDHVKEVSSRIMDFIREDDPEIFRIEEGEILKAGCDPQLWTIATKKYFNNNKGVFP